MGNPEQTREAHPSCSGSQSEYLLLVSSGRHRWVEFVVGSHLCSESFSSGTQVFPSPQKPTFPNSNSTRNQVDEEPL